MDTQNQIQKKLMDELGLSDLPADKQEQLLLKMTESLLKRIFVETMEKLEKEDQDIYGKMIDDKKSQEEIEKFLREKIENYDQMLEKIADDFKEELKKTSV